MIYIQLILAISTFIKIDKVWVFLYLRVSFLFLIEETWEKVAGAKVLRQTQTWTVL